MQMSIEKILDKIIIINGDCAEKGLNLSSDDREKITSNVSIIYHFCATIKFDEVFDFYFVYL